MHHPRHSIAVADGNINNRPTIVSHVLVVRLSAHKEGTLQISFHHGSEALATDFTGFGNELTPRIVNQHFEGAVPVNDVLHKPDYVRFVPYVGGRAGHDPAWEAEGIQLLGRTLASGFGPAGDHNSRPERRKLLSNRPANARSTTRDEGYLAPEQVVAKTALPGG